MMRQNNMWLIKKHSVKHSKYYMKMIKVHESIDNITYHVDDQSPVFIIRVPGVGNFILKRNDKDI